MVPSSAALISRDLHVSMSHYVPKQPSIKGSCSSSCIPHVQTGWPSDSSHLKVQTSDNRSHCLFFLLTDLFDCFFVCFTDDPKLHEMQQHMRTFASAENHLSKRIKAAHALARALNVSLPHQRVAQLMSASPKEVNLLRSHLDKILSALRQLLSDKFVWPVFSTPAVN